MELQKVLMDAGLSRNEAKILTYLFQNKKGFSREIERKMDMRQPEASIALKGCISRNWITRKDISHKGKGRPNVLFSLKKTKKEIAVELMLSCDRKIKGLNKVREELKGI